MQFIKLIKHSEHTSNLVPTLEKPFVVEDQVESGLAPRHVQLPELVVVPDERVVASNRKLQRLGRNEIAEMQTRGGLEEQQLPVDLGGVAVLQRNPGDGDLQVAAGVDVDVHGVRLLVLREQDVHRGLVLHGQPDVEGLHLSFLPGLRHRRHLHRQVVLRVEELEQVLPLAVRPWAVAEVGALAAFHVHAPLRRAGFHDVAVRQRDQNWFLRH